MRRKAVTRNLGATIRPLSSAMRKRVRDGYTGPTRLTAESREELAEVVWGVMDELECRSPKHPQVEVLRAVYNVLLDDLGINQTQPGAHYPHVEAAEAIMLERRRRGRSAEHMRRIRPQRPPAERERA